MTSKLRTSNNRQHERVLLEKPQKMNVKGKQIASNERFKRKAKTSSRVSVGAAISTAKKTTGSHKEQEDRMIVQAKVRHM